MTGTIIEATGSGSTYNIIMSLPVYYANKTQAEAAAALFVQQNGITATRVNLPPGAWWYIGPEGMDFRTDENYELEALLWGSGFIDELLQAYSQPGFTDAQARTMVQNFLASNNQTMTMLTSWPYPTSGIYYSYEERWGGINWGIAWGDGYSETQWNAMWDSLMKWYRGNYLERYLISLNIQPAYDIFVKFRAVFSLNNTKITLTPIVSINADIFENIQDARAADFPYEDEAVELFRP